MAAWGLVTASVAGQLGVKTVLIDAGANLGGDCLHYGCVPSKTLIRSAEVAALTRRAGEFGLQAELGPVDLGAVMDRVRQVIDQIQVHDDPDRFRGYGVDVRFGHARFLDRDTVSVDGERLQARRFVIATGSAPAVPGAGAGRGGVPHQRDHLPTAHPTAPAGGYGRRSDRY